MDIRRLAICRSMEPTTCLEASKAHTFKGRCGLSRHRLKTSDSNASDPNAACMISAKGPNSRHSPFSAPGGASVVEVADTVEATATMAMIEEGDSVPRAEPDGSAVP